LDLFDSITYVGAFAPFLLLYMGCMAGAVGLGLYIYIFFGLTTFIFAMVGLWASMQTYVYYLSNMVGALKGARAADHFVHSQTQKVILSLIDVQALASAFISSEVCGGSVERLPEVEAFHDFIIGSAGIGQRSDGNSKRAGDTLELVSYKRVVAFYEELLEQCVGSAPVGARQGQQEPSSKPISVGDITLAVTELLQGQANNSSICR
jgi:hypothetical protein